MTALAAQGVSYQVAASVDNSDIEFISVTADDIHQIDREVILARSDFQVVTTSTGLFRERVTVPLVGDAVVEIPRGGVMANAVVDRFEIRFVSTHLEVSAFHDIQINQAEEQVREIPQSAGTTILVGDINSRPIPSIPNTYSTILDAGYTDTWMMVTDNPGPTCCHADDLLNETPRLAGRIDVIVDRGNVTPISTHVVGDKPEDLTSSGLWPSDHDGVVTTFSLP
tara:strand:+ start:464 stop:1138 length:675 start_codon:yes stop_codon:yes gene_type:complete